MTRREFAKYIGYFTLSVSMFEIVDLFTLVGCGTTSFNPQIIPPSFTPGTTDEKTMSALIDTILPGYGSDPAGGPGAIQADALLMVYDKAYPAYQFVQIIVNLLNSIANTTYKSAFYELDLSKRATLLSDLENEVPYMGLLIRYIEGAFYAGFVNDVGYEYLTYPGANLGYVNQGFSFNRQMSQELTNDGNLP